MSFKLATCMKETNQLFKTRNPKLVTENINLPANPINQKKSQQFEILKNPVKQRGFYFEVFFI